MMQFASSLNNPLLQVAVSMNEPVLRAACHGDAEVRIAAGVRQFPDGRDSIIVAMSSVHGSCRFEMLLRNYFDRTILERVARRAWRLRTMPAAERPAPPARALPSPALVAAQRN